MFPYSGLMEELPLGEGMVGAEEQEGMAGQEVIQEREEQIDEATAERMYEAVSVLKKIPTSLAWRFMHFKESTSRKGADQSRVYCKLCDGQKKQIGIPYSGSTSNLVNHLKSNHSQEYFEVEKGIEKKKETDKNANSIKNHFEAKEIPKWSKSSFKWKEMTMMISKWVAKDSRPVSIVEDEGFIRLMAMARPEYVVPVHNTISNYIENLYKEEKARVKQELGEIEYVAKTTDGGSSSNCSSFQETGVHGITEDFHLKYFTLEVKEVKEAHTAINYRKNTDRVEEEFEVKDKVVMTTSDNENKMRLAFKDHERNGCLSHILHSSVKEGIAKQPEVEAAVLKQRRIITKQNKSFVVKYGLQEAQKKAGIKQRPLIQDVPTRWGSTRVSTGSILDHEDDKDPEEGALVASAVFGNELRGFKNAQAINTALRKHKFKNKEKLQDYLLTRADMLRIKNINAFLTAFDIYSTTLGGNKFVTGSIVMPVLKSIQLHLAPDEEEPHYIAQMKATIKKDFGERTMKNLNAAYLLKATALDPRFKKLKVVDDKAEREKIYDCLREEAKENLDNIEGKGSEPAPVEKKRKIGLDWEESDSEEEAEEDVIKREIDSYRAEPELSREEEDILKWWRGRRTLYPNLARLAR